MCGINGILHFNQQQVEPEILHHMGDQMIHRGPDDQGIWIGNQVGLGFRRLSIIDAEGAHQPITNEDGNIRLVCNGEIYNYRSLREDLRAKGHRFRTNGDVETILHLYEEYGKDCLHHLRGMFAFVIWDERTDTLFAARDNFGIKPFYYKVDEEAFICSSELKSILSVSEHKPEMDMQSMMYYLTYQYVPEPRTMVEGVSKLPSAHYLMIQDGQFHVEQYWSPNFEATEESEDKIRENIVESLRDSVRHHMQSDVPRGCFLSSGIDSTTIAALMREQELIHTFSVGFEGPNNECMISRKTAAELKTQHHEWIIGEQEYFDMVHNCVWFQDDPVADPSAIALNGVSKLAAEHVKVVLSGEGADELFGGYGIYKEPGALSYLQWIPTSLKDTLNPMIKGLSHFYGKNYLLRATTALENRYVGNAKIFSDDVHEVISDKVRSQVYNMKDAFQFAKQFYRKVDGLDDVTRMQYLDLHLWLPGDILAKADKMSMAHSIELRVPFLDRKVFEVARKIPAKYRIEKQLTKRIFREALKDVVPPSILFRPKLGFPVPLRDWLRGDRGSVCLEMIRSSGLKQYINMNYVEQLVHQHQSGKSDYARKIWCLYTLAHWHVLFIEDFQPAHM